jgi:hypothetical protein
MKSFKEFIEQEYSITRHPNGTYLIVDRGSELRGLYDNNGRYLHGDLKLPVSVVIKIIT